MTHPEDSTKRCCTCGETLPTSAFFRSKPRKDGLDPRCKACQRARKATYVPPVPDATEREHLLLRMSDADRTRFWSRVDRSGDCWEWQGTISHGYGDFTMRRAKWRAHRVSYVLAFGAFPDELFVLHRCDNPRCVNPAHLFLGTHDDNMADKMAKGRNVYGAEHGRNTQPEATARGERNGSARLTNELVTEIRRRYQHGNGVQMAREYGISQASLWAIVARKTWRHLP